MTFKIDCDGVLRNLLERMCNIYNVEFGTNIKPEDCLYYDVDKVFTLCQEKLGISARNFMFNQYSQLLFKYGPIFDKAKEAIDMLHEAGHKIIIVTAQSSVDNKIYTLEWLRDNNIYYDDIVFTENKDIVKGDYMIDDSLDILNDISKPTIPICIVAPYNKQNFKYRKYNSLYDFVVDFLNNTQNKNKISKRLYNFKMRF